MMKLESLLIKYAPLFDLENYNITQDEYRKKWINNGGEWFDSQKKPQEWDIKQQLKNVKEQRQTKKKGLL